MNNTNDMIKNKKVWVNFIPSIDVSILTSGLEERGFEVKQVSVSSGDEEGTIKEAEGCCAIVSGLEPWNEHTLYGVDNTKLKLIVRFGAGYDNINIPIAEKAGIAVTNAPGKNAIAVAEAALMHMLTASRKYRMCCNMLIDGTYKMEKTIGQELTGKTLGILGFGTIGKYLRQMVRGFDMKVLVYDLYKDYEFEEKFDIKYVDNIEEIYHQCDFISIHVPLIPSTKNMINRDSFSLMKSNAVIVNTSRGGIINENDLYDALKNHVIRAAGLDVSTSEPVQPSNKLLSLENLSVTPHCAGSSEESLTRTQIHILNIFDAFFSNKEVQNLLNPGYIKYRKF